ncbi:ferrochelatase [Massilibacteroides sp.]|uniref:ferrochelatase n=1 Tax=Massilibacteroides sp. TaxID=2034766 RepID=UPI0026022211|nr:ferrochelatase [Massilibacteroides sp.]MDD4515578.1 ferrochelatase [Massilibacteroides sp.]
MDIKKKRTALLLINLGTPDAPTIGAVSRYLIEFLNDKYVIDIPWFLRKLLVNLVIIPSRVRNSTKLYKMLWTPEGSPLTVYSEQLRKKLQESYDDRIEVFTAMRYQNPSIESALNKINKTGFDSLIVLPLYPQFTFSTTTSTIEKVERVIKEWKIKPTVHYIKQFYNHSGYIEAFTKRIKSYNPDLYDFILFSYHGLPNSHIAKAHSNGEECDCTYEENLPEHGRFCYRAACYHTTQLLATRLHLNKEQYTISFQSRLSKDWLKPFSDKTLIDLARRGHKRVLVVAPAFVADCLETIIEIGVEYKDLFIANGGQTLTLVESLNADDQWVEGVKEIISEFIDKP